MKRFAGQVFLIGQSTSLLGDGFALLAVPLLVLTLSRDPLAAGLAAVPRGVGYLLVGLPVGPLVDRLDPWTVLMASDAVRAAVFVALPVLVWLDAAPLWAVLAGAFAAGVATVFFDAALAVAVGDLFGGPGLLRANAVLETAAQLSRVLGPAMVGVLAATVGIGAALLVNAGTFVLSLCSLLVVSRGARLPRPARSGRLFTGLGRDFKAGIRFVIGLRPLLALTAVQAMVNLCLAVDTLLVFLAHVTLALPLSQVSLVVAAGGAGGVVGAALAPRIAARIRPLPLVAGGITLVAVTLVVMAAGPAWWVLLAANSLQFAALTAVSVVNRSTRQSWIPRDLLGRVTTTVRALFMAATPAGAALAGVVTRAFGNDPRPAFLAAGALTALAVGVGWFGVLRRHAASATGQHES
ncbi:MFS transporter [Longispora sp. NPDC051575]|uniref:MFS transporter n=1 Tax=Longispora sp. NPDC051575 TaxID=3154943 RepID=UPI0034337AC4